MCKGCRSMTTRKRSSLGAPSQKDCLDRFEHDEQIKTDGQVLDVVEIVFELLFCLLQGRSILVSNLCPACQSRTNDVAQFIEWNFAIEPIHELWPLGSRTNESHVSPEYIPKLRNLVQSRLAHELA